MSKLSKKDFADKVGMKTNKLSVYIQRGKVVMTGDEIDTSLPQNELFLKKYAGNMLISATEEEEKLERQSRKKEVPKEVSESFALDIHRKKVENEKAELGRELLAAKLGKQRAELIPFETVKMALGQHFKDLTTSLGHGIQNLLVEVAHRSKMNVNQKAELHAAMERTVNDSINRAIDATTTTLRKIQKEHSEKRDIGEKAA